ncbi:midasin-like, partial [Lingula anatina]|uniref:Midasin-like n=1 Tax=Lingula anatina TaxID=7574 RepID=A0A1S3J3X0_LINAN
MPRMCFYSTLSTCLPKHPLPEHVPALPDQKDAEHWVCALDDLLITAWETLQQVHILLYCCPEKCAGDTVYPSVLPSQHLAGIALVCKGDGTWTETMDKLQIIINKIEEVTKEARTENKAELVSLGKVKRINTAFQQLSSLVPSLSEVAALFSAPGGALNSLNSSLNYLIQQITNTANAYSAWLNKERSWDEFSEETIQDSIRTFRTKLNDVITTILLGVQNLVKLIGNEAMEEGEEEREEEDEGIDLKDGHLTELQAKLEKAVANIGMEKVIAGVQSLLIEVKTTPAMSQLLNPKCDLLSLCIPALDQYTKLAQYYVTEMAATHRATAKLLSVLLGVFTELTLK